jgi:hypothetical protein
MSNYQVSANSGNIMGTYEGNTPAEALLLCHRDAGYGEDQVWLDKDGGIVFIDEDTRILCGDLNDWFVEEY